MKWLRVFSGKHSTFPIWMLFFAYFVISIESLSACTSVVIGSTPLSVFLNDKLTESEVKQLAGSSLPEATLTGHINFLIDGYDPCADSGGGLNDQPVPMVLYLPNLGAVQISPDPVYTEYLRGMCGVDIFGQTGGVFSLPAFWSELVNPSLDFGIEDRKSQESDLLEFVQRCTVEISGKFELTEDEPFFHIERIIGLTRSIGKWELEHLQENHNEYIEQLCERATIRRAATNSWEWWNGDSVIKAKEFGLDCPKLMQDRSQ